MKGYTQFLSAPLIPKESLSFHFSWANHIIAQLYLTEMWRKRKAIFPSTYKRRQHTWTSGICPQKVVRDPPGSCDDTGRRIQIHIRHGNLSDAHHRKWIFDGRAKTHCLSNPPFHRTKKFSLVFSSLRS